MMMVEEEDLGLCLSSSYHQNRNQKPLSKLNLTMMPSSSSSSFNPPINKLSWKYQYGSSPTSDHQNWLDSNAGRGEGTAFMLRGIDVNRLPSTADGEDEAGVSSPNSTVSSLSGKRSERECQDQANCSPAIVSDEEDGETSRKKLRLSKDQSSILEESFKLHNTLNPKQKLALAKQLGLRPRQVEVWFQNRRARTKLKQTEVDCEFLRRCCDNLTEENRRLQREVLELRALKHSPQFYMPMAPPTTLTMCPSCERVAAPPGPSDALRSDRTRPPIAINTRTGPGPGTGPFAYRHSTRDRN